MRGLMIVLVIVALAAAGGVSFFTNRLIDEVRDKPATPLEAEVPTPPMVAVAASDIAPGATLTDKAVRWQPWPADALRPEYALVPANAAQPEAVKANALPRFAGKVARRPIAAGQPLTDELVFTRGDAGFLAGTLEKGFRAVAVPVAADSAAAGFILPGDRVDVILSQDVRRHVGEAVAAQARDVALVRYAAETVVENVRVLAVDQSMAAGEEAADVVETATLEVTPDQAEALAVARHMGAISLTLRSLEEPAMMVAGDAGPAMDEAGDIVQASGVALAVGRQAAGTWVGDVEVSPSLAAVAGFDRNGNPLPSAQPAAPAAPAAETGPAPEPEPWRVTIHRGREPAEVVRGRDDEDAADAGDQGFDEVYRGSPAPAVNADRLNRGFSAMRGGAFGGTPTRIIGGG
ncbi:Flp pilus assembly CpaB [Caenispirillum salinarum AK4]|uniref:Flp pilus assembly CpaB n=1 Tax=Caenispirillum salinarum AK4 TaxID=1238182 RepID=K9GXK2_9PROT|nr:Flp pilus assembly protein CpaB [Caenispirillum salinarum]EKV30690.1 Flp pilus assembly CpaB [Caenispirillum salinarum AK4]